MYKKSFLICLLLLTQLFFVQAQKVDLDKRKFETKYALLPTDPTLSYFDTYGVDFFAEQTTLDQLGLSASTINSYFDLEGYVYTKAQAQFNYSISIDKPIALLEGIEEVLQTVKNTDGTSKVVTMYVAVATYAIPTNLSLKLIPEGSVLYSSSFSTRGVPTVYKSSPQTTRDAAQSILNSKSKGLNTNALGLYSQTLKAEVTKLKQKYCFQSYTSASLLWEIDEKSAPELAPFNKEVNTAIAILEKLDKNIPLTSAHTEIIPSLTYWSEKAASIQSTDKNLIKLKYACLYNMAVSQYYLELFDDCAASCQLLIANNYDKNDGSILQTQANSAKETIKNSGLTSRHQKRPGFTSTEHFEYTPIVLKKPNFIEQNKQDFKELKGSVNVLVKDIDDDFSNPKITDTLLNTVTYFSSITFEQDGEVITYKGNDLSAGSGMPNQRSSACDPETYSLSITKKIGIIPPKAGTMIRCDLNFQTNYKRSQKFNADSLITLIKKYEQDKIVDITNCSKDSIPFVINGEYIQGIRLLGKNYDKKLSADLTFMYSAPGAEGSLFYKTNIGDAFNVKVVNVVPVIVKEDGNFYNITPNAYLVTLQIPEVTLTKLLIGHIWLYKKDYITIKNIELKVLLFNTTPK